MKKTMLIVTMAVSFVFISAVEVFSKEYNIGMEKVIINPPRGLAPMPDNPIFALMTPESLKLLEGYASPSFIKKASRKNAPPMTTWAMADTVTSLERIKVSEKEFIESEADAITSVDTADLKEISNMVKDRSIFVIDIEKPVNLGKQCGVKGKYYGVMQISSVKEEGGGKSTVVTGLGTLLVKDKVVMLLLHRNFENESSIVAVKDDLTAWCEDTIRRNK